MLDINSMKKIESFIIKELNLNLADAAIFQHDENTYELFNKFIIKKVSTYRFLVITDSEEKAFSFLKNAVMWCTFKQRDKFYEMMRIEELDILLSGIDVMAEQHKRLLLNTKNSDDKLIYVAKLNEDKLKKQVITYELNQYILDAKQWQMKKFESTAKSLYK